MDSEQSAYNRFKSCEDGIYYQESKTRQTPFDIHHDDIFSAFDIGINHFNRTPPMTSSYNSENYSMEQSTNDLYYNTFPEIDGMIAKYYDKLNDKELKLIHKIIENIIQHPNDGKYQDLHKKRMSKKFNNELWIQLFISIGFQESENGERLTFNIRKLHQLKYANNLLFVHQLNKEENENNMKERKICRFYGSKVKCRDGDKCRDLHDFPNAIKQCKYSDNNCPFGQKCRDRHWIFPESVNEDDCKYIITSYNDTELEYQVLSTELENNYNDTMSMIITMKHYMVPLSMRFWTLKHQIFNDTIECAICLLAFETENFLEHWVSRKLMNKAQEETEIVSAKNIAIQLSRCKGEHFFHCECIAKWFLRKNKCPLCQEKYGHIIGYQPNGTMNVIIDKNEDVDGYENKGKGMIKIIHKFAAGVQGEFHQNPGKQYESDKRELYLPNSQKGREILELIKIGWKRKILYTVGRSVSRKIDNVIIYNGIHFKTNRYGGIEQYGWPDIEYFDRVKQEFKEKGINIYDIPKRKN